MFFLLYSLIVLILSVLFGVAFSSLLSISSEQFTNVSYLSEDSARITAYLAIPDRNTFNSSLLPAVMILHDSGGLNHNLVVLANELASVGFVTLVPDLYRGIASPDSNSIYNKWLVSTTPLARVLSDIDAAHQYLVGLEHVDQYKVCLGPGLGFGGALVFYKLMVESDMYACSVSLYTDYVEDLVAQQDWGILNQYSRPMLGLYGRYDTDPSLSDVMKLDQILREREVTHEIIVYDKLGHGFLESELVHGNRSQVALAWDKIINFLDQHGRNRVLDYQDAGLSIS